MAFYVFILECADGSYYTNHSTNLDKSLQQINEAENSTCFTYKRLPVKLVYKDEFDSRDAALKSERRIKSWSRKKKRALIVGDWSQISSLAKPNKPEKGVLH